MKVERYRLLFVLLVAIFAHFSAANDVILQKLEKCAASNKSLTVLRCDINDNKLNIVVNVTTQLDEVLVSKFYFRFSHFLKNSLF
jgi:hypothetical protein